MIVTSHTQSVRACHPLALSRHPYPTPPFPTYLQTIEKHWVELFLFETRLALRIENLGGGILATTNSYYESIVALVEKCVVSCLRPKLILWILTKHPFSVLLMKYDFHRNLTLVTLGKQISDFPSDFLHKVSHRRLPKVYVCTCQVRTDTVRTYRVKGGASSTSVHYRLTSSVRTYVLDATAGKNHFLTVTGQKAGIQSAGKHTHTTNYPLRTLVGKENITLGKDLSRTLQ